MWTLLPLLSVPLIIMVILHQKNPGTFAVKEFFLLEAGMVVLLMGGFLMARSQSMADQEIWSGRIIKKKDGTQSCCHCTTVCDARDKEGKCTSSHEECDHSRDYWWSLVVSTGDTLPVKDCSGSSTPPASWERAYIGEPAAVEHNFQNYLLADRDSVMRQQAISDGKAPPYPRVHGLYQIDRAINLGTRMDAYVWSRQIDDLNADLGASKWVNVIVVATTRRDPAFAQVIERDWLYGKLNDAIFVLGAPDGETVEWAAVITIPTGNASLRVAGRDALVGANLTRPGETLETIEGLVRSEWKWTGMDQLAYLASSARPSTMALVLLYLTAIVGSVVGSLFMISNHVFDGANVPNPRRTSHFRQ